MKRTYISPEFDYKPIFGTFDMQESPSFFGAKLMDIEDKIEIKNSNLSYNQLASGEQLDLASENNLPRIVYDTTINKSLNHSLELDPNQSDFDKENSAKWIFRIEIRDILRNHLFALLKNARTFEGIRRGYVINGDVDSAIFDYINKNILNRYELRETELFISYTDLCGDNTLQWGNVWDKFIESESTKQKKFLSQISQDERFLTLNFTQEKPAFNFSFRYYFNLYYEKI